MHHSKHIKSSCGRCMHSQHNPCPTELTSCVEGSMTREGSAWWGDVNEKRNKVKEEQRGGGGISMHHSKPTTSSCARCMHG